MVTRPVLVISVIALSIDGAVMFLLPTGSSSFIITTGGLQIAILMKLTKILKVRSTTTPSEDVSLIPHSLLPWMSTLGNTDKMRVYGSYELNRAASLRSTSMVSSSGQTSPGSWQSLLTPAFYASSFTSQIFFSSLFRVGSLSSTSAGSSMTKNTIVNGIYAMTCPFTSASMLNAQP